MARLLHRLGRGCADRAGLVVTTWVLLLALAGGAYALFGGAISSAVTIPGTPTAQVTDRLAASLPQASGGAGGVVFATRDGTPLTAEQRAAVSADLQRAAAVPGTTGVVDPFAVEAQRAAQAQQLQAGADQAAAGVAQLQAAQAQLQAAAASGQGDPAALAQVQAQLAAAEAGAAQAADGQTLLRLAQGYRTVSADGSAALGSVTFAAPLMEVPQEVRDQVRAALTAQEVPGVAVEVTSDLAGTEVGVGVGEVAGLVVAAVVLLVALGTALAASLPLVGAVVGVGVAVLAALSLSGTVEITSSTPLLGVMLGLAVGIDYSLFILNRHRRQLREGVGVRESIALAAGTSGTAVLFAGGTVVIALAALTTTGIGFLGVMGLVAAFAVLVAVAVALTLLPAVLRLAGTRVLRRRERPAATAHPAHPAHRAAGAAAPPARPMATGRAVASLVAGVVVLAVIALPALSLRLGLPDGSSEAESSTQYQAYATTARAFGPGQNGPLLVVADTPEQVRTASADAAQATTTAFLAATAEQVAAVPGVTAVVPIGASADRALVAYQVVPAEGPTSQATADLVDRLRATTATGTGAPLQVAGAASGNIDISDKLAAALPVYLVVVLGLSLVLLVLVFRSLLVPVVATAGFALSLLAAFGATTAVFQWGWLGSVVGVHDPGPVLNFLPTLMVGILFGLAMDYQLFIGSGVREAHVHGQDARTAVTTGLRAGRRVVTAAAIIMVSVFGGFVFSPTTIIRQVGFGLAVGVLLDAFVVRLLVVPAVLHLAGERAWWLPRWLDRLLPDVDVEGASLERPGGVDGSVDGGEAVEPAGSGAPGVAQPA